MRATREVNADGLPFDFWKLNGAQKSHLKRLLQLPESSLENPTAAAEYNIAALFDLLARLIRYEEFMMVCGAEEYPQLYGVALMDTFTTHPDEEKARRSKVEPDRIEAIREHPAYERLARRMREEMERLNTTRTIDEIAELLEPALARELAKIAMGSGREAAVALEAFLDRRSAKVPRAKAGQMTALVMTEGAMLTLQDGEERMKRIPARTDADPKVQ